MRCDAIRQDNVFFGLWVLFSEHWPGAVWFILSREPRDGFSPSFALQYKPDGVLVETGKKMDSMLSAVTWSYSYRYQ